VHEACAELPEPAAVELEAVFGFGQLSLADLFLDQLQLGQLLLPPRLPALESADGLRDERDVLVKGCYFCVLAAGFERVLVYLIAEALDFLGDVARLRARVPLVRLRPKLGQLDLQVPVALLQVLDLRLVVHGLHVVLDLA
jgi:hypothetical protein